jgi:hypothetical protein
MGRGVKNRHAWDDHQRRFLIGERKVKNRANAITLAEKFCHLERDQADQVLLTEL